MNIPQLEIDEAYSGECAPCRWTGIRVLQKQEFALFLAGMVFPEAEDLELSAQFQAEISALATTGMETKFVQQVLASRSLSRDWQLGEALAKSLLKADRDRTVVWPWNENRDLRTPLANLPGADLVGFCTCAGKTSILIGEVKTSSSPDAPPSVMHGRSGMIWQLDRAAHSLPIQHTLLMWLLARCNTPHLKHLFRAAAQRYVASDGKDIVIAGVLIRDTLANEKDIASRAAQLAATLSYPTDAELIAWYLPEKVAHWRALAENA